MRVVVSPARRPIWRRVLDGHLPSLPRAVDACAEWWASRRPRVRGVVIAVVIAVAVTSCEARVRTAERRWGGEPVTVLVAADDLGVGSSPSPLRALRVPAHAAPVTAVTSVPSGRVLVLPLPEGTVLTKAHLDPRGPAAGLPAHLRAVPVPVEEGWGIVGGGWVDVWVLGASDEPTKLAARTRPVLELKQGPPDTALVAMAADEVAAATDGLALGRVLLTHAPPPLAMCTAPPCPGATLAPSHD